MSIFLKWGVPAFVTVVGGTAAAIATSGSTIPSDLASRSERAIAPADSHWAAVSFDMRDAAVSGTATTQQMIDNVVARVSAVHGVRSVTSNVVLAEYVSPFPFVATVQDGVITLSGGLPDETARADLLAMAGQSATDQTRPMSGGPARSEWRTAVGYALEYARRMDEGEVALADLELTVSGRAKSPEAYSELNRLASESPPAGVSLAFREFQPAVVSPFEWRAEYDGSRLNLSGVTPSEALVAELQALVPAGTTVSTSLELASGAPANFEPSAVLLTKNLLQLEHGNATISDTTSTLAGSPANPAIAEAVRVAMTPTATEVTLGPPQVDEYWLSAERTAAGIVLDGFVPDEAALERLEALDAVDASGLELGRGAPERFESGVDFVIDTLRRMSEGHATIQGTVINIEGRAATSADFETIETNLDLGAPQGLMLAATSIKPPLATPFTFTAEKAADGGMTLSGYVPSKATRKAIASAVPGAPTDSLVVADGNPSDFEVSAVKALGVLALLDSGKLTYDGASWSLTGDVDTSHEAFAAESAFAATGLRTAGWTYNVALPAATEVAALPVIDPYTWRAQKAPGGAITFAGFVPTEQLKRYLAGHAGDGAVDGTALGAGAPEGFVPAAIAGLDAILAMDEGVVSLSAASWSLTGSVPKTDDRHAVEAVLKAAADTAAWHVAIQAADAAPVVAPFIWSAAKAADGSFTISGYVPSEQLKRFLAVRAAKVSADTTLVGSGEPENFIPDTLAGLDALLILSSGEVRYDGKGWTLSGQPKTAADAAAAKSAVDAAPGAVGWKLAIAEPSEPTRAVAATETVEPAGADVVVAPSEQPAAAEAVEPAPLEEADPAAAGETEQSAPAERETQVAALEPAVEPASQPVDRNYLFEAVKPLGGPIGFRGAVPAEPMRRHLAVIAGVEPSADLSVGAGLPEDFIPNADAGSRALAMLADGEFGLDGDTWVLTGRAETAEGRQAALDALTTVPSGDKWETNVTLLPPLLVCRERVDAFAARNAILFQSGSARIAEGSEPAIDELAAYLALCPEAAVNIEGHTDADGDDDANLALSVSRAEAVVDALILRGVSPDRLYAIGYGESLPIESNETRAGKQANRRIAFTLSDE